MGLPGCVFPGCVLPGCGFPGCVFPGCVLAPKPWPVRIFKYFILPSSYLKKSHSIWRDYFKVLLRMVLQMVKRFPTQNPISQVCTDIKILMVILCIFYVNSNRGIFWDKLWIFFPHSSFINISLIMLTYVKQTLKKYEHFVGTKKVRFNAFWKRFVDPKLSPKTCLNYH